jgi:hypothetical protein
MSSAEGKMLGRVRALLAKAEHPTTPRPEAEAAHAKAAELMMRYALDEATLAAELGDGPDPVVYWEHVAAGGDGHGRARCTAAGTVVQAYGGRYARRGNGTYRADVTLLIVSTRAARDALALLLPSLYLQMDQAGRRETDEYMGTLPAELFPRRSDRTRWANSYFKAFLVGYADAVGRRITAAREMLRQEAVLESATSRALVLVNDQDRIAAEFQNRFPDLGRARAQRLRADGYAAGQTAGRSADIGVGHLPGDRRTLTP